MFFDSHAHYDDGRFDDIRDELLADLKNYHVGRVVNIGANIETSKAAAALADKYDFIYAAVGVHPQDADTMNETAAQTLEALLKHPKVRALGEIGLDYHYEEPSREAQKACFIRQMQLADKLKVPVIIHDRDAHADCLDIIKAFPDVKGVVHCFSGSAEMAKELLRLGYLISFTGVVTFKNAKKSLEVIEAVPLDKMMIETDCPYLAPEPFRGRLNHSGYIYRVAETIAEIKNVTSEEVADATYKNACNFYRI